MSTAGVSIHVKWVGMVCREAQAHADKLERKLKNVQLVVSEICGRARNSYSKGVLKKDFKDGLLEMEETAADVEFDAGGLSLTGIAQLYLSGHMSASVRLCIISALKRPEFTKSNKNECMHRGDLTPAMTVNCS